MVGRQLGLPMIFEVSELCPATCQTETYLSIVIVNNRRRNRIDTLWEINHGRCVSPRHADARCTSSARCDRLLDRSCIIRYPVAHSTVVLHVSKHLVTIRYVRAILVEAKVRGIFVERSNTLVSDILHPVGGARAITGRLRDSKYWILSHSHRRRVLVSKVRDGMSVPSVVRNSNAGTSNGGKSKETHFNSLTSDWKEGGERSVSRQQRAVDSASLGRFSYY
jgi:hypothetical protein